MTTSGELFVKPSWRFLLSHPAHLLSFGFGSGLARKAPGTFGTLVAFPLYWALSLRLTDLGILLVLVLAFAIGVWVCGITGRALGVADYGAARPHYIIRCRAFCLPAGAASTATACGIGAGVARRRHGRNRYFRRIACRSRAYSGGLASGCAA